MYKLICIEGFDRIGKDYLVDRLGIKRKKLKIYNKISKAPDYRGNPHVFENWIQQHLINQLKEMKELRSNVLKIRYFTSEYVYSTLFNRKTPVDQIFNEINNYFEIHQYIMLFKNYTEYFNRCIDLNSEPEYGEEEFYKINQLYENSPFNEKVHTKILYGVDSKIDFVRNDILGVLG